MKSLFHRSFGAFVAAALAGGAAAIVGAQQPGLPASPLAGGNAAATGHAFMDAHGNPIVMPASYGAPMGYGGEGCYGGDGAACAYGGAGYGDAACGYADFGGYSSPDQCGPHYFDIAVYSVFLQGDDLFQDVLPFGSIGVGGPTILDPDQTFDDYEAGWQIAARFDLGPLSVIEGTYMGLYDIGFNDTVRSVDVAPLGADFQLNTVFSDYGNNPIIGLDEGSIFNLEYQSDLQSTELSYRRYWVGYNPRVSGTYLAGFRYIRMTEDLTFNSEALQGDSSLLWSTDNDLVGAQIGGDGWIALRQGLRLGGETKAGIYNNRFKYRHATNVPDPAITNVDFVTDGNQVAFAGEASVDLVADILPSFSIRGGYRALYLNSLVSVGNQIVPADLASTALFTQADAIYHGFHAGIEYIW
jgi:hypothetical protein